MHGKPVVVGIGEVLWDLLPRGAHLGGAPANFAYFSGLLGASAVLVSRTGNDHLGREARDTLLRHGLDLAYCQIDTAHATGSTQVSFTGDGSPQYAIAKDVAWDYLQWTPALAELAARADAVCFGTLAQRSPVSRETIRRFLEHTPAHCLRMFDVNLRAPFYSDAIVRESLSLANVLKLSCEELRPVLAALSLPLSAEVEAVSHLRRSYGLRAVCLTRGAQGSVIAVENEVVIHSGMTVDVADTVGAGDAFTAAVAMHLLAGSAAQVVSEAANSLGAWVASQPGAMPKLQEFDRNNMRLFNP